MWFKAARADQVDSDAGLVGDSRGPKRGSAPLPGSIPTVRERRRSTDMVHWLRDGELCRSMTDFRAEIASASSATEEAVGTYAFK
jgi:hypothetical protein